MQKDGGYNLGVDMLRGVLTHPKVGQRVVGRERWAHGLQFSAHKSFRARKPDYGVSSPPS